MRFYITACCLLSGIILTGCTRPLESKSQPPLPIASGEVIRAIWEEQVVPANGILTNYVVKARTVTEGHVVIYDGGTVIVTEPDGTKHGERISNFVELSFK
ncbi:MAG TPA: hypothetical protein VK815_12855 [Candidatus Acidoferrales bacterium]|nr:hypothetical protein [Candidatus Acidoferrales bacterium]